MTTRSSKTFLVESTTFLRNARPSLRSYAIVWLLLLKVLRHKLPGDVAIVVGELVQVVLVLLGARDVAGKRQHLDADPVAVGPRPHVGLRLAQVGGVLAVNAGAVLLADVGALPVHAVGVDDLEEVAHQLGHGHAALVERRLDALGVPVVGPLEVIAGPVRPPRLGGDEAGQRLFCLQSLSLWTNAANC